MLFEIELDQFSLNSFQFAVLVQSLIFGDIQFRFSDVQHVTFFFQYLKGCFFITFNKIIVVCVVEYNKKIICLSLTEQSANKSRHCFQIGVLVMENNGSKKHLLYKHFQISYNQGSV